MKVELTTTFDALRKYGACEDGYRKLAKSLGGIKKYGKDTPINLLHILESNGVDDCLWALRAVKHQELDSIARYIACDCADAVLHIFERERPNDNRPRLAIQAGRDFADGKIDAAAWAAAMDAAMAAARDAAMDAARDAAWDAAMAAARAAAMAAAGAAAWDAAMAAARDAAMAAAWDAAWDAAWATARDAQSEIICRYLK